MSFESKATSKNSVSFGAGTGTVGSQTSDAGDGLDVVLTAENFPTEETLRALEAVKAKKEPLTAREKASLLILEAFENDIECYEANALQGKDGIAAELDFLGRIDLDQLTKKDRAEIEATKRALRKVQDQFDTLIAKEGGGTLLERVCSMSLTGKQIFDAHNEIQDLLKKHTLDKNAVKGIEPPFRPKTWETFSLTCEAMHKWLSAILARPIVASSDDDNDQNLADGNPDYSIILDNEVADTAGGTGTSNSRTGSIFGTNGQSSLLPSLKTTFFS